MATAKHPRRRAGERGSAERDRVVQALLAAYREGAFPMADGPRGRVRFYTADPRAIVPIEKAPGEGGGVVVSRSLRALLKGCPFEISSDRAFGEVIRACAKVPRGEEGGGGGGTWISEEIVGWYEALHAAGHAHSVEAWREGRLVGGLYGVHIGGAFFGESMFSLPEQGGSNASKVCFVHLVKHLRAIGVVLLDTQFINPHMASLGAVEIPLKEYLARLANAVSVDVRWGDWV
ncbi:MAG: leucyl/phenylalanyl-tRNA--protein transferase [Phycisphaerales bacterium]